MRTVVIDADWEPKPEYDVSEREHRTRRAMDASGVWKNSTLEVETRERPTPGSDEVLVRVRYAGICGSDLSMLATDEDGYVHYSAYATFPNVIGHEFAGEIVETGADVRLFEEGDLVTSEVTDYCGRCNACRQGSPGHCNRFEQLGFTISGAFAEFVAVPEKLCWNVSPLRNAYDDEDALLKAAATIEPATITYHGLFARAEGILPGDYHVYHGAGPIGLTGMNVSRGAGAGAVIAFEPSDERRAIAREIGFEHVYDPLERDPVDVIDEVTNGEGADVHVETSGAVSQTYPVIEDSLAEGANVVHISNAGSDPAIALRKYQGSTAQIYGAEGHTGQRIYPRVIRMMAAGRVDNSPIVTTTMALSDADDAFERAAERVDGKVLLEM
ncbi:scyllo-inosose 3-dehydrogenase [Natrarchaeobius oligotrophus]|uniref:Zn-dependent alcohol dehydrogenase n=1 Tax=Natrarchaeobius chitinivorans TaxID=1679083 RepID=A0A3N6NRH9_NATCH|nr:scyllo-inosose 3-dehydrogenase [Natrarchaeobius chitinivorans]RQH02653.1 Zn-dependent alcohol dehydrogenase [Natrarchaeobius chitinivorans]